LVVIVNLIVIAQVDELDIWIQKSTCHCQIVTDVVCFIFYSLSLAVAKDCGIVFLLNQLQQSSSSCFG